jgi:hypothetical protein
VAESGPGRLLEAAEAAELADPIRVQLVIACRCGELRSSSRRHDQSHDSASRHHDESGDEANEPTGNGGRNAKLEYGKPSSGRVGKEAEDQAGERPDHAG